MHPPLPDRRLVNVPLSGDRPVRDLISSLSATALMAALFVGSSARAQDRQAGEPAPDEDKPKAQAQDLPGPEEIPEFKLPTLRTVPARHGTREFNVQMVDASALPRDPEKTWILNFSFKPIRIRTVEVPGKGRRKIHYLYYRVVNRPAKGQPADPRLFAPQFSLVTDTGKRYEDVPIPGAVKVIQAAEDPAIPLHGAVTVMGMVPPSTKPDIDDAVYGVAVWEGVDPKADRFSVYIRGLSNAMQVVHPPDGGAPVVKHKTLRLDFIRRGDERNIHSGEIEMLDPPYEWIYW
jgi:hypothetical protein